MPTKKDTNKPRGRLGRPPTGDVKARILLAAQQVFLDRGYQGASIDEIAELAPASKPTIYAHFPGKEALFHAVVAHVINGLTNFDGCAPRGRTVQDKLVALGTELVEKFLEDRVRVTRVAIAEAERFPALSRHVHKSMRDRTAAAVSHILNDASATLSRSPKGAFGPKRAGATAQIFVDLLLLPMQMRAPVGVEDRVLRKETPSFVRERVSFFLTACKAGWGK
jgi:AcrR family transcriptional regulator